MTQAPGLSCGTQGFTAAGCRRPPMATAEGEAQAWKLIIGDVEPPNSQLTAPMTPPPRTRRSVGVLTPNGPQTNTAPQSSPRAGGGTDLARREPRHPDTLPGVCHSLCGAINRSRFRSPESHGRPCSVAFRLRLLPQYEDDM